MNLSRATTTVPTPLFSCRPRCWYPHACPCYFATVRSLSSLILPVSLAADDLGICTCCRCRVGHCTWRRGKRREDGVGWQLSCGVYIIASWELQQSGQIPTRRAQDLDYKHSRLGESSPYFRNLAFLPLYFHCVIGIGASAGHNPRGNPIVHVDVSSWGKDISENLQLLHETGKEKLE